MSASHGWSLVDRQRKQELIQAIVSGETPRGPVHVELDLTDRCNVACYFCNQMDVRTKEQVPFERVDTLIDELVAGGLRSVRLSGGGDPLMYREIVPFLDRLGEAGVVVDNLTTNGALLSEAIAERLVRHEAREVIFSLNAVDAADYQRMMKVRAKTFDDVLANLRRLREMRGASTLPKLVVQFLLDKANYRRLPEMYLLGRELGVDRVAVNLVLDIPNQRIDPDGLLSPSHKSVVRPYLEKVLHADREAQLLQICFPWQDWNDMADAINARVGARPTNPYPTAPSFKDKNGHCFFGFYTAAIRGTGEMYPCCMLMNPDYEPLGNIREGGFREQWEGEGFSTLRREMREVLLTGGRLFRKQERFKTLRPQCVEEHTCGLKNMYFRGDEEFYRELGEALDNARRKELGWLGGPERLARSAEVFAFRAYHGIRVRTHPARVWLQRRVRKVKSLMNGKDHPTLLHIGSGDKRLEGWINIDMQKLPGVDVVADVTRGLDYENVRAVYAEHFLEHLAVDDALAFLAEVHRVMGKDGWLRLSTPNLDWVWATHYTLDPAADKDLMAIRLNRAFHGWQHRFLWNRPMLERALAACGFEDIAFRRYGESPHAIFSGIERHETYEDAPELPHVLIVEARKGETRPEELTRLRELLGTEFLAHLKG